MEKNMKASLFATLIIFATISYASADCHGPGCQQAAPVQTVTTTGKVSTSASDDYNQSIKRAQYNAQTQAKQECGSDAIVRISDFKIETTHPRSTTYTYIYTLSATATFECH
jgi:hypothetical protein